jgi:hypothetical protein
MDRRKAFCMAMMFGNLRKGGGGRADMPTFMACMDVIWRNNPQHIVSNIRFIMEVCDILQCFYLLHFLCSDLWLL